MRMSWHKWLVGFILAVLFFVTMVPIFLVMIAIRIIYDIKEELTHEA